MIVALRGTLTRWDEERSAAWLEVGGITYEISMPAFAAEWVAAQRLGEEVLVYTYQHATDRQPVPTLFGFPRLAEREFFRKFIEVPDIGPAKAVRALTRPVSEVARWIESEDTRGLRQLPGIGDRLASTIVARLKGKLVQEALLRDTTTGELVAGPDARGDAIEALVALQYGRREAEVLVTEALRDRTDLTTVEDVLRHVLSRQATSA
ncbi:MAG: Holliday junction branch migration protein RuvA [Dehalococcoidia bacterium]